LYSEGQYSSEGFPYARFDPDAVLAWIPAQSLPSGEELLVPASLVYLNYPCRRPEEYLAAQTSNGLATGPDLYAAILGGLYELVERDGFLIHWSNRLAAPRVDLEGLGGLPRSIARHFRRYGMQVCVYNLTVDIPVPVMLGLLIDRSGRGPAAAAGLGCHINPAEALRKALMEMCQVYAGEVMKLKYGMNRNPIPSFQDVREAGDHSSFFSAPEALAELGFLLEGGRVQRVEDLPNLSGGRTRADLEICVERLDRAGSRVFYVDLTTPDIVPFGLRVVRTLATGLQPIHFGYGQERRGGKRLFEVPVSMGYSTSVTLETELNPCPHPLA
jgi:ribosomal protein S12 methylthiotransferase accessory factor